jgi:hypothetical protein
VGGKGVRGEVQDSCVWALVENNDTKET